MKNLVWIAVDWGTSHLRAFAMDAGGQVLDKAQSADGMATLAQAEFEPALLRLVGPWLGSDPVTVLACGMVGARQGWIEAAYQPVPCKPGSAGLTRARAQDLRLDVLILPGLSQASPTDVMRGEETQILGVLAENPDFDGIICLPGTHTKWAHVSAGEVVSFQTAMTGEIFALLAEKSVLRHSLGGGDLDKGTFDTAIADMLSRPERLAHSLFGIRAASLLTDQSNSVARGRLSGLLIGAELAATRPYWLGREIAIAGAPALSALYARALKSQGVSVAVKPGDDLTLHGLRRAYETQRKATI
jgi:2-dehydro-3-deoxygalactonokinase